MAIKICFQCLLFITTCYGLLHLQAVLKYIYKILGRLITFYKKNRFYFIKRVKIHKNIYFLCNFCFYMF